MINPFHLPRRLNQAHPVASHGGLDFLRYDIPAAKAKLVRSHFDVGSCTLALAESAPGLRIEVEKKHWLILNIKTKQRFSLIKNFEAMLGYESGLLPGWHDVTQMEKRLLGVPVQRWSIVVFVDTVDPLVAP